MSDSPGAVAAGSPAALGLVPAARRPLVRLYVLFAWTTGVTITVLYICLILQHFHVKAADPIAELVGVVHGVGLYPIYVVLSIATAFVYRLSIPHMALMALAGLLPGLSPYVARKTVRHVDAKIVQKAERDARIAAMKQKKAKKAQSAKTAVAGAQDAVPVDAPISR
jgi:integral membrane protein